MTFALQSTDRQLLEEMLAEPLSSVRQREHVTLDRLLASVGNRVVLFGAGHLGRRSLACLRSIGISPLAFADNNPSLWNSEIDSCRILAPRDAAAQLGADALFMVTIWNANHWYGDTRKRLLEYGCKHIVPVSAIYWRFADEFLPFFCQDLPHKVYQARDRVIAAHSLWSDEQSRQIYLSQIRWRTLGEWDSFLGPDPEESYFPEDIFSLRSTENFIDCGAFDGDTIRSFIARTGSEFESILALEADAATFSKLQDFVEGLEPILKSKILLLHVAVGAEPHTMHFDCRIGVDPRKNGATSQGKCASLDALLHDRVASYIKMDIEGAEYDALNGAFHTIRRERPILAVCVYHTQEDIWRLPLLIHDWVQDYMFFLREHDGDGWQTVLYAVPAERVQAESLRTLQQQLAR
jgi:FkbM family methyltransferase